MTMTSHGAAIARDVNALRAFPLVNKFTIARNSRQRRSELSGTHWRLQEMRFNGLVLVAAFAALGACGGGEKGSSDTSATATPAAGTTTGGAAGGAATRAAAAAPVNGTVHQREMVGDEEGY